MTSVPSKYWNIYQDYIYLIDWETIFYYHSKIIKRYYFFIYGIVLTNISIQNGESYIDQINRWNRSISNHNEKNINRKEINFYFLLRLKWKIFRKMESHREDLIFVIKKYLYENRFNLVSFYMFYFCVIHILFNIIFFDNNSIYQSFCEFSKQKP